MSTSVRPQDPAYRTVVLADHDDYDYYTKELNVIDVTEDEIRQRDKII